MLSTTSHDNNKQLYVGLDMHLSLGLVLGMQMMTFTQHPYMLLSSKALPLWIALLSPRDSLAKQESQGPTPPHTLLPMECVSALLDLAGALLNLTICIQQRLPW